MPPAAVPAEPLSARCGGCLHFRSDPAAMEEAFPGLSSMGSGYGSVRAGDGLCGRHGYYLAVWDRCRDFEARPPRAHAGIS